MMEKLGVHARFCGYSGLDFIVAAGCISAAMADSDSPSLSGQAGKCPRPSANLLASSVVFPGTVMPHANAAPNQTAPAFRDPA